VTTRKLQQSVSLAGLQAARGEASDSTTTTTYVKKKKPTQAGLLFCTAPCRKVAYVSATLRQVI
jgi:hypothetical protein